MSKNLGEAQLERVRPPYNLLRKVFSREEISLFCEVLTLEEYVEVIANLTDIFLSSALEGATLALDENQNRIISKHRRFRRRLALHLDNTVLHNPRDPELKFCDKQKPYAKLSKSILELATGISDNWLIKDYFVAPKLLWLWCETALCRDSLKKDGLLASLGLDSEIPYLSSKKEDRDNNKSLMSSLDVKNPFEEEKFKKAFGWKKSTQAEMDESIWYNPLPYLTAESYLKARDNPEFDTQYFIPYQRAWASVRNANKSSDVQYSGIDAYGNLQFSEPHTNRRNRGFPKK